MDISSADEFAKLFTGEYNLSKKYILQSDINLETVFQQAEINLSSSKGREFSGVLDGNGYTLKNFTGADFHLFNSVLKQGVIKNICIQDIDTTSYDSKSLFCNTLHGKLHNITLKDISYTINEKNSVIFGLLATNMRPTAEICDISIENIDYINESIQDCGFIVGGVGRLPENYTAVLKNISIKNSRFKTDGGGVICYTVRTGVVKNITVKHLDLETYSTQRNITCIINLLFNTTADENLISLENILYEDISVSGYNTVKTFLSVQTQEKIQLKEIQAKDVQQFKTNYQSLKNIDSTFHLEITEFDSKSDTICDYTDEFYSSLNTSFQITYPTLKQKVKMYESPIIILENDSVVFELYTDVAVIRYNVDTINYQPFNISDYLHKFDTDFTILYINSNFKELLTVANL